MMNKIYTIYTNCLQLFHLKCLFPFFFFLFFPFPYHHHQPIYCMTLAMPELDMKSADSKSPIPPKVNQAAFIHKLYSMLEDDSIKHLITWTPSNTSFVISPGEEFSKVLAQYFKHTNPSSFVRQLNMYGFHKVNDSFNNTSGSENQWEFKHTSFKRGDVESLRAIKRRTSRTTVTNTSTPAMLNGSAKMGIPVPSTPPPLDTPQPSSPYTYPSVVYGPGYTHGYDSSLESRLSALEHSLFTLKTTNSLILSRYNSLVDSCKKSHTEMLKLMNLLARTAESPAHQHELNEIKTNLAALNYHNFEEFSHGSHQPPHPPAASNFIQKSEISYASSRERAPSIFYDPLAPIPNEPAGQSNPAPNMNTASHTPITNPGIMHRQSAPGILSYPKPPPANLASGSPAAGEYNNAPLGNTANPNGGPLHHLHPPPPPQFQYPFGSGPSSNHQLPPTSTPYFYNDPSSLPRDQLPSRNQRPASFPFISPFSSRQSYSGGPLIPKDYYHRRHTSGDLLKSITSTPLPSASRHGSFASSTSSSEDKPRSVQSLLNPTTNSEDIGPERKKVKIEEKS